MGSIFMFIIHVIWGREGGVVSGGFLAAFFGNVTSFC